MTEGGTSGCHLTSSDSNPGGCFGTTKLNWMSGFSDNPYARDTAYEGADFKVRDRTGMEQFSVCQNIEGEHGLYTVIKLVQYAMV